MWWLQTGSYSTHGLYWLIALGVVFVISVIALIVAGSALARAGAARRAGASYLRGAPGERRATGNRGAIGTGPEELTTPASSGMLDERYAKGEISREEYLQRQEDLRPKV